MNRSLSKQDKQHLIIHLCKQIDKALEEELKALTLSEGMATRMSFFASTGLKASYRLMCKRPFSLGNLGSHGVCFCKVLRNEMFMAQNALAIRFQVVDCRGNQSHDSALNDTLPAS